MLIRLDLRFGFGKGCCDIRPYMAHLNTCIFLVSNIRLVSVGDLFQRQTESNMNFDTQFKTYISLPSVT